MPMLPKVEPGLKVKTRDHPKSISIKTTTTRSLTNNRFVPSQLHLQIFLRMLRITALFAGADAIS